MIYLSEIVLETRNISKVFPGIVALKDVNIKIRKGTVHALLGENGAGKSTLVKILSGAYEASSGSIILNGREYSKLNPTLAMEYGISIIHQELNLIPEMSIAENIYIGREKTNIYGAVNFNEMNKLARLYLDKFGVKVNPKTKICDLSIAHQQIVEIAKALSLDSNIIIMDEPSDVLTERETKSLFDVIRNLKREGKSIIYITHRLDELPEICDDFTVLRDGKFIKDGQVQDYTKNEIVKLMVGREISEQYPYIPCVPGKEALRLEHCFKAGVINDVSISLNTGEVVGFAGLVGSGRTELARCIFGVDKFDKGLIHINGKSVKINSARQAIKKGIFYTTENRKEEGLSLEAPVYFNITMSSLDNMISKFRTIQSSKEKTVSKEVSKRLSIKSPSLNAEVKNLSGGNQQKVILARGLLTEPKIMILDEPTRGIDVGAKSEIYKIINELKSHGVSIAFISSELPELLGICDRIYVMCKGNINGEFLRSNASEANIMQCAFGISGDKNND